MAMTTTPSTPASELQADGLLPCPAGHDAAKLYREKHDQTDSRSQYPIHWAYIDCKHRHEDGSVCGWHLGGFPTAAEAVAAWNTRTPPPQEAPAPVRAVAVDHVTDRMVRAAVVSYVNRNDQLRPTEWMRRVLVTALLVGTQDLERENSRERKEEIWGM